MSISEISGSAAENVWDAGRVEEAQTDELPAVLEAEAVQHCGEINVRALCGQIGLQLEAARDGKILVKTEEMRALRNKLGSITDFLGEAQKKLAEVKGDTIQMVGPEYAALLEDLNKILPEKSRELLADPAKLQRRHIEHLCQMLTRKIDTEIVPQIDELKDAIFDIMQTHDKMLPILRDMMKRYDDHINHINRQPK